MTVGLVGYASYLPRYRLAGSDIGLRRGDRVVASFDEDATTMAVAAAMEALQSTSPPAAIYFATSTPAYADKTNATAIHAALGADDEVFAADVNGTARSTFAAVRACAVSGGLVVASDVRVGKPGSADEKTGGDGAAAVVFGAGPAIAEVLGTAARTAEFLDRWRHPLSATGHQWEERFGVDRYGTLIRTTANAVLQAAGISDPDHVVLVCPNAAVVKRAATLVKGQKSQIATETGHLGAADPLVGLAGALDVAEPGDTILVLSATDGCDAMVLRATAELAASRQRTPLRRQRDGGLVVPHLTYLSWRGLLDLEPPRRPEPDRAAAPPAARSARWKFGLLGTRCRRCDFAHLPPLRICRSCGADGDMATVAAAGLSGTVVTYTVDRLAYSPSPPMVQAVIDVDGGGRCTLEVADAQPEGLAVGTRVRFAFRRLFTADDVHDYFWKAVADDGQ